MALRKVFSYKHHCDKYGNGHYDSNNGYQTFSTAPWETIDSCRHMSASGFWWLFPWTFTFWMNTIDNDRLFLFGRHIFFSTINVGFTSFLSEIWATYCSLKLLEGMRKYLPRKSMPTWSDLDNLTPLTRSNLGQDPYQRHDFLLCFFFLLIWRSILFGLQSHGTIQDLLKMGVHKCPMRRTVWSSEKLISYVLYGHYWLLRAFGPISVLSHYNIHHVQISSLSESALAYTFSFQFRDSIEPPKHSWIISTSPDFHGVSDTFAITSCANKTEIVFHR